MALLRMPEPYDFELSTERYRAFGPDLANLWHDDALHRVVDGREVRIADTPDGSRRRAARHRDRAGRSQAAGRASSISTSSTASPRASRRSRRSSRELRGLRPPVAVEPFESLVTSITAQQVSLHSAFAIRNRLIERFGVRAEHAYAFPTRERIAAAEPDELTALGFSRRKAEYAVGLARSDLDLGEPRRPSRRRGQGHADRAAGDRRVDC